MGHSNQGLKLPLAAALVAVLAVPPHSVFADSSVGGAGGSSSSSDSDARQLDEIIVTASKRAEKLREVADSVTAFTGNELSQLGAQSFQDYVGRTPGVIFQQANPGLSNVTIRGVGTATGNPDQGQGTTGIYLNDIPLTDPAFALAIPDIDTFDMQRVEVLRGPQGTLFGAAALGGAINYIINPVNLNTFDTLLESSVSGTQHSTQVGYTAKEAINLPLITDVFGIRITAIKRFDPGYLDNIGTGQKNANSYDDESYRINSLWQINNKVSASFFSFYDRAESPDASIALPSLGTLRRDTTIPEFRDFLTRINSLKVDADLDFATLTATGARTQKNMTQVADFTAFFGPGAAEFSFPTNSETTSEVRLTSPTGGAIEWLFGVYHGSMTESYPGPVLQNGKLIFVVTSNYVDNETSEFGEATYRFSDQWRATVGGRHYDINFQSDSQTGAPPSPPVIAGREESNGFSPKGSITYEPNGDFLAYALVSKGYRTGGVNLGIPPLAGYTTPATYGPDSLVNYEIGVRPAWLDHQLTLDSTLFFINWSDIQLRLSRPDGYAYAANAGGAHNLGLENALNWTATSNLQFQLNATYLHAEISRTTDLGSGIVLEKGATIPGASRWTASELTTYHWNTDFHPYVTASVRFVSAAQSGFTNEPNSPSLPIMNYTVFDLRTGINVNKWGFSLYANNITDRRAVTAAYVGGTGPDPAADRVFFLQPRTAGLRVDWHF